MKHVLFLFSFVLFLPLPTFRYSFFLLPSGLLDKVFRVAIPFAVSLQSFTFNRHFPSLSSDLVTELVKTLQAFRQLDETKPLAWLSDVPHAVWHQAVGPGPSPPPAKYTAVQLLVLTL